MLLDKISSHCRIWAKKVDHVSEYNHSWFRNSEIMTSMTFNAKHLGKVCVWDWSAIEKKYQIQRSGTGYPRRYLTQKLIFFKFCWCLFHKRWTFLGLHWFLFCCSKLLTLDLIRMWVHTNLICFLTFSRFILSLPNLSGSLAIRAEKLQHQSAV